jgi:hypothetical protein
MIFRSMTTLSPMPSTSNEPGVGGRQHLGEGAEALHELLGDGLHVPARDGAEEDEFQQFVIRQRIAAHLHEAGAQPVAMAVIMGSLVAAHARPSLLPIDAPGQPRSIDVTL